VALLTSLPTIVICPYILWQIERIENHNLWQLYMVHRDSMKKNSGTSGSQVERLLWHGTAVDSLDNIYAGGFNRSYCGKNGTLQ